MSYLLRVMLPDQPGSLGGLAVALGSVNADIISLDVVDRLEGYAVDDIVVDVPGGTLPDSLITAAEQLDGVVVDSLQPFGGVLDAHRELELIDAVASAGANALEILAEQAPQVLRVGWSMVLQRSSAGWTVATRASSAPSTPDAAPGELCEGSDARSVDTALAPEQWSAMDTALAIASIGSGRRLLVGRPGGPEFRPSEIARLGHFAGILRSLDAS